MILKIKSINTCFLFLLIFCASKITGQERVYDLSYNPALYNEYKHAQGNKRTALVKNNYLIVPTTLNLPFFDDFSKDRLFQPKPWNNLVFDTINRSVQLGSIVDSIEYINDTSWNYSVVGGALDSTPKQKFQLVLNDDPFDPQIPTDTIDAWPSYFRYTLDGGVLDSTKAKPDSIITIRYSVFELIRDTTSLWLENQVYINNTYVPNNISYNVAAFDGLNENGLPYDVDVTNGPADTLTSQALDLSGFTFSDNIFLSFFYLSTGNGNKPEEEDSLILEFNVSGNWTKAWGREGFSSLNDVVDEWQIAMVPISDNFFFTQNFQFRFRNKASLTGNNDHWYIDYVYLAPNRSATDTIIRDVSVLGPPTNFLDRYTSMPWNQYDGFESQETAEDIFLSYKNNFSSQQAISYFYRVDEVTNSGPVNIYTLPTQGTALPPFSPFTIDFPTSDFVPFNGSDSILIRLTNILDEIPAAITTDNDTASMLVPFYNYFAYDDGSAEKAYGVEGPGLKKFAYEFNLNVPDTLRAIRFHFTQINFDASDLLFTLNVWDEIDQSGTGEDVILYSKEFLTPRYASSRDGFVTYLLDSPILVEGQIYIGWEQTDENNIQVGLDVNNSAQEYMYYKIGPNWNGSLVEAAPMIRPVLGKELPVSVPEVKSRPEAEFTIFPNPSSGRFNIDVSREGNYEYVVFDLQGKKVNSGNFSGQRHQFDLQNATPGFYLLQIFDRNKQKAQAFRLIKM